MVVFRGADGPGVLLDRCPHRNVPLGGGKIVDGTLQCPYHGWRFARGGACVAVPGLVGEATHKGREATGYPTVERDGLVWVWCEPDVEPDHQPMDLAPPTDGFTTVWAVMDFEGSVHAVAENALDVPHTAFLHGGLFRTSTKQNVITCQITRERDRVQCQYIGEPRPTGLMARLLAPGGGLVEHYDRFILPSTTQVEYKLGGGASHVLAVQVLTPIDDFYTRMYAVLHFKIPILPSWLIRLVVTPVAMKVLRQDAAMLKLQTANVEYFGGERYVSTEIDVLGPHIWRLLKAAERGDLSEGERDVKEVEMHV